MTCPDESTLQQLAEGRLPKERMDELWTHLSACQDCACLLAMCVTHANSQDGSDLHRHQQDHLRICKGTVLGRYVVLDRLGAGGMGLVFAAYDPQLDRRIALKLLKHRDHGEQARVRFQQEAQAMARLSHPNVVTVFDAGEMNGQPFIAMELVEDGSLDAWLTRSPTLRETLQMFVAAGRGLAAAHHAGLVHRDFKPQNVLVDSTGRARVTDFGLARWHQDDNESTVAQEVSPLTLDVSTQPGSILGTPRYMSPEQLDGQPATAQSDQFSYCVALWEALYGLPPFPMGSPKDLRQTMRHTRLPAKAPKDGLPPAVHHALLKGLNVEPAQRFASMDELLRELQVNPVSRGKRTLLVTAVALGVLLAAAGSSYMLQQPRPCQGAARHLQGVWDDAREDTVRRALQATQHPLAEYAVRGVKQRLDAYAHQWTTQHTAACEATRIHGEQSEELMQARMECLEQGRQELKALVDILAQADGQMVERAISAVDALRSLERCADGRSLLAKVKLPDNPRAAPEAERLGVELARVKALVDAGRFMQARTLLASYHAAVEALGHLPLQAEARLQLGRAQAEMGERDEAAQSLRAAAVAFETARHDEDAGRAYLQLIYVLVGLQRQTTLGTIFVEQAEACLARVKPAPELRGRLEFMRAQIAFYQPDRELDRACSHQREAVKFLEAAGEPNVRNLASARSFLGSILVEQGRMDEGLQQQELAMRISSQVLGPDHPTVAIIINNLADAYMQAGRLEQALATHQRALESYTRSMGEMSGPAALSMSSVGEVLGLLGQDESSLALLHQAVQRLESAHGPTHPTVALGLYRLGLQLTRCGRAKEALVPLQRALAIWEKTMGTERHTLAKTLTALGDALVHSGRSAEAIPVLQRAVDLLVVGKMPVQLALARFALATAWDSTHTHGTEVAPLIRDCERVLRQAGRLHAATWQQAQIWLQRHGVATAAE